jgi:hypothetical protein
MAVILLIGCFAFLTRKISQNSRLKTELQDLSLKVTRAKGGLKRLEERLSELGHRDTSIDEPDVTKESIEKPDTQPEKITNDNKAQPAQDDKEAKQLAKLRKKHNRFMFELLMLIQAKGSIVKKLGKEKAREKWMDWVIKKTSHYLGLSEAQELAFKNSLRDWFIKAMPTLRQISKRSNQLWDHRDGKKRLSGEEIKRINEEIEELNAKLEKPAKELFEKTKAILEDGDLKQKTFAMTKLRDYLMIVAKIPSKGFITIYH